MTKIYLIRHAEAEGNLYRRSLGQCSGSLSPLGKRQTAALAERFRDIPLDGVWSSDLQRAMSTASALVKYHPGLSVQPAKELREMGMGIWEDRPWGNVNREFPELIYIFYHDPVKWSVPGGEPYVNVIRRVEAFLLARAAEHPGGTLGVVTHSLAIRAVVTDLLGIPYDAIPYAPNTGVALLTAEDGHLAVEYYNDAAHLAPEMIVQGISECWFTPMELPREKDLYVRCYADTWQASHGDLKDFVPGPYLRNAVVRSQEDPQCLLKLIEGEDLAGIVELDPDRGAVESAGWISLLWIDPAKRGRRLGAQLLGHAVAYFRRKGRKCVRLHVSQTNDRAVGFYEAVGFQRIGTAAGAGGPLYLMELDITQPYWTLP